MCKLTCDEVQAVLWPRPRPRRVSAEEQAARRHLRVCAVCRTFFERDPALAARVARCGGDATAPARLRQRVLEGIRGVAIGES